MRALAAGLRGHRRDVLAYLDQWAEDRQAAPDPDVLAYRGRSEADLPVELGQDAQAYRDQWVEDRQGAPDPDARAHPVGRDRSAVALQALGQDALAGSGDPGRDAPVGREAPDRHDHRGRQR